MKGSYWRSRRSRNRCGTIRTLFCFGRAVGRRRWQTVANLLDENRDFAVDQVGPVPWYVVSASLCNDPPAAGGETFQIFLALIPKRNHFRLQFCRMAGSGIRALLRILRENQDG